MGTERWAILLLFIKQIGIKFSVFEEFKRDAFISHFISVKLKKIVVTTITHLLPFQFQQRESFNFSRTKSYSIDFIPRLFLNHTGIGTEQIEPKSDWFPSAFCFFRVDIPHYKEKNGCIEIRQFDFSLLESVMSNAFFSISGAFWLVFEIISTSWSKKKWLSIL